MRARRSLLGWGVFLVCLGAVPLAVQAGWLDRATVGGLVQLWPLILVGIGLGLMLRMTPLEALGGIVVAGTFGVLIGVALAGGIAGVASGCPGARSGGQQISQNGAFAGSASVNLEFTCADVSVDRGPGSGWMVVVSAGDRQPLISSSGASLVLRSADASGVVPFTGNVREDWQVTLPGASSISADVTLNATHSTLALGNGPLGSVDLTYNAADGELNLTGATSASSSISLSATYNGGSGRLILPDATTAGHVTLNAASLNMCLPVSAGARITYHGTISSQNFGSSGLSQNGDVWQTSNYVSAENRIDLDVSANVSSISLDRSGGCQ
jgi:hypothetical protein